MKHSNFYQIYQNIKKCEEQELIAAVKAHGGVYEFCPKDKDRYDTDNGICPIVSAWNKYAESPSDYCIVKVEVESTEYGDWLTIYGIEKDGGWETEAVNVEFGHMHYIIDYIAETDGVSDVSIKINAEALIK